MLAESSRIRCAARVVPLRHSMGAGLRIDGGGESPPAAQGRAAAARNFCFPAYATGHSRNDSRAPRRWVCYFPGGGWRLGGDGFAVGAVLWHQPARGFALCAEIDLLA